MPPKVFSKQEERGEMAHQNETPPLGAAGLGECCFSKENNSQSAPNPAVTQAKIELLREDITETIGPMIASLEAAVAMARIPNDAGMLHGLRNARAYWRSITGSAGELQQLRGGPAPSPTGDAS
jgi:hypothetical protein